MTNGIRNKTKQFLWFVLGTFWVPFQIKFCFQFFLVEMEIQKKTNKSVKLIRSILDEAREKFLSH